MSAALLARRGLEVTVIEGEPTVGGKLRARDVAGMAIDAGPTVFTMRHVFDAIFADCGAHMEDHLALLPADVLARHAWPDGSRLDLHADAEASVDAIGTFAGAAAIPGYLAFRAEAKRIFDALDAPFIQRSRTGPLGLGWRMGTAGFGDYCTLRPYTSLWRALGGYFADPRLRQLFARYATYCGSSPFAGPATLMLIAHVEASGVWLIEGGMHRLAQALATLAEREGATIRPGCAVATVDVTHGRAGGVTLSTGERLSADHVIVNADPAAIGGGRFGDAITRSVATVPRAARSLSAMVWMMRGQVAGMPLAAHNVAFSDDYRGEFDALASGRVPPSPTVYVRAQTDDAFQIIVNAPANGDTQNHTRQEIDRCRTQMLGALARCGVTLTPTAEAVSTPADFEALNRSTGGALYGRASHGWAASFRRQGARTRTAGLYCAGGSCHPGAGVPMAALSGRQAAECLLLDRASTARFHRPATAGGTSTRSATRTGPMEANTA